MIRQLNILHIQQVNKHNIHHTFLYNYRFTKFHQVCNSTMQTFTKHVTNHAICQLLDMMFQHPVMVQCALFYALLYARLILLGNPRPHILLTKQRAFVFRISCAIIPKGVTIF